LQGWAAKLAPFLNYAAIAAWAVRQVSASMPTISEEQLSNWTAPAFNNEDARRRYTEGLIREAIAADEFLSSLPIEVYAKGSYKNNTNVRRDSDVDIAVEYTGVVFFGYWQSATEENVWAERGIRPYSGPLRNAYGAFDIDRFKDAIDSALAKAFGSASVTRHNKVFTVRESDRSLATDVVPCVTYDQHWSASGYAEGIQLLADRQPRRSVVNFPRQHYANGVAKNEDTSRRFKRVVRILKNLENKMVADGATPEVASYLIESLVFNCPDSCFNASTWTRRVQNVLAHIWKDTEDLESEERWHEVNNIKFLFHSYQRWDREDARVFAKAAWQYVRNS
jgi:hypothetical protein